MEEITLASSLQDSETHAPHLGWIRFPKGDLVGESLRDGSYASRLQAFFWSYLRTGDTFVDGGAHVGVFSALAAQAGVQRVLAIEPNPEAAPFLESNLNSAVTGMQADVHRQALTAGDCSVRFRIAPAPLGSLSALTGDRDSTAEGLIFKVPGVTLENLLVNVDNAVLRLDVEGAELLSLAGLGATAACVQAVVVRCVELKLRRLGASTAELVSCLRHLGWQITTLGADLQLAAAEVSDVIWADDLIAVRDIKAANQRLQSADSEASRISRDLLAREHSFPTSTVRSELERDRLATTLLREAQAKDLNRIAELERQLDNAHQQLNEAYTRIGEANWHTAEANRRVQQYREEIASLRLGSTSVTEAT